MRPDWYSRLLLTASAALLLAASERRVFNQRSLAGSRSGYPAAQYPPHAVAFGPASALPVVQEVRLVGYQ